MESAVRMLVANKCDQLDKREVTKEEGMDLAKTHNMPYVECSAKTANGVESVFVTIAKTIMERNKDPQDGKEQKGVRLMEAGKQGPKTTGGAAEEKKKNGCC
jgi:GTPase SAR1 family protein